MGERNHINKPTNFYFTVIKGKWARVFLSFPLQRMTTNFRTRRENVRPTTPTKSVVVHKVNK